MILNGIPLSLRSELLLTTSIPELMQWMRVRDLPLWAQFAHYGIPVIREGKGILSMDFSA